MIELSSAFVLQMRKQLNYSLKVARRISQCKRTALVCGV